MKDNQSESLPGEIEQPSPAVLRDAQRSPEPGSVAEILARMSAPVEETAGSGASHHGSASADSSPVTTDVESAGVAAQETQVLLEEPLPLAPLANEPQQTIVTGLGQHEAGIVGTPIPPEGAGGSDDSSSDRGSTRRFAGRQWAVRIAVWIILVGVVGYVGIKGWQFRTWITQQTTTVRFPHDLDNALNQSRQVRNDALELDRKLVEEAKASGKSVFSEEQLRQIAAGWPSNESFRQAYLDRYDKVVEEAAQGPDPQAYLLDYQPYRLLAVCLWERWVVDPPEGPVGSKPISRYRERWTEPDLVPLMTGNRIAEIIASLSTMGLVWIWRRRAGFGDISTAIYAALAGSLLWWNFAAISVGHAWAQWDVWAVTFYLLAAFLASANCWAWAGAMIALGCMFKGQIFLAAPILVLWPIFQLRWRAVISIVAGFALGLALFTWPWTVPAQSHLWLLTVLIGVLVMGIEPLLARLFHTTDDKVPVTATDSPDAQKQNASQQNTSQQDADSLPEVLGTPARHGHSSKHQIEVALVALCACICVLWPWSKSLLTFWKLDASHLWEILSAAALLGAVLLVRPAAKHVGWSWLALIGAGAMWLANWSMGGNLNWARVGLLYGADHFKSMGVGTVANLPKILEVNFGIQVTDPLLSGPWMIVQITALFLAGVLFVGGAVALAMWIYRRARISSSKSRQVLWLTGGLAGMVLLVVLGGWGLSRWAADWANAEPITVRPLLRGIYFIFLVAMAAGLAIQSRTRQVYGLIAIGGIWVVAFSILPQMHERYLMYGAVATALFAGVNLGMTLLHLLITACSAVMIWRTLISFDPRFQPWIEQWTRGMIPGIGWAVLVVAMVILWQSIAWRPRRLLPEE